MNLEIRRWLSYLKLNTTSLKEICFNKTHYTLSYIDTDETPQNICIIMGCTSSSTAAAAVENTAAAKATRTTRATTTRTSTEHSFMSNAGATDIAIAIAAPDIQKTDHAAATATPSSIPSYSSSTTNKPCLYTMQETFKKELLLSNSSAISGTVGGGNNSEDDVNAAACEWTIRYACLSVKGRDPEDASKPNQDSFGVTENFLNNSLFFGVYDGHGAFGKECSQLAQQRLPRLIQEQIIQQDYRYNPQQQQQSQTQLLHASLYKAHIAYNEELHATETIDDAYSGTTSISLFMELIRSPDNHNATNACRITVCNVGDSRAILGTTCNCILTRANDDDDDHDHDNNNHATTNTASLLQTVSLSIDQTPKRSDEAARCKKAGARILSFGEINPSPHADSDDDVEDPPRIWAQDGNYPGTAFSRSFGDAVAETLGVHAQPEISTLHLSRHEKCIVLATDGVFDVLSNQQVMDLCFAHYNNKKNDNNDSAAATSACQAVLEASYQEWLRNEECGDDEASASYDDMTIICIFIGS